MATLPQLFLELINLPGIAYNLYRHRYLIFSLTLRDFRLRFRGSFGGILWPFIQPFILMVIYTLVFSGFLKIKFPGSDSPYAFPVYLLCGLLPWTAFAESFSSATTLIGANSNLVKRVVFPLEILPLKDVMTNSLQFAIGLLLLLPVSWLFNGKMNATWAALPLILVLQMMFYVGLTWIWASLTVYIPDLRQSTALLLTVVMFLTPIFYPIEIVPEWAQPIMRGNPFANLVTIYRLTIMDGILPSLAQWVFLIAVAFISFMLGYFWFFRTKKGFADVL